MGWNDKPAKLVKKSIRQSQDRYAANNSSSYQDSDDDGDTSSILDSPEHKQAVYLAAQRKTNNARAIYNESRNPDHWQYLQECISKEDAAYRAL